MTEMDWIDATAFGSAYETQCRIVGTRTEWRHRMHRFMFVSEYNNGHPTKNMVTGEGAWRVGLPRSEPVVRKRK